jgi:Zn-dependent protease with chaperone function
MAILATAAALLVIYASAASLLLVPAYRIVSASLPPGLATHRAQLYRDALFAPVAVAVVLTAYGFQRQLLHPLFSPHAGALRPHLCVRALLEAPDSRWRTMIFCGVCLFLVLTAVVALVVRLVRGAQESAVLRRSGQPLAAPEWAPDVEIVETEAVGLAAHRGAGRLVAMSPRLGQFFPPAQAEAIRAHEICHARRRDGLGQTLAQSAVLLAGLSPLSYLAYREWLQARELVCDLRAAQETTPAVVQAALARAQELTGALAEILPLAAPPLDTRAGLSGRRERLAAALAESPAPGRGSPVGALVIVVALVVLAVIFRREAGDTLQCLTESFLRVLG